MLASRCLLALALAAAATGCTSDRSRAVPVLSGTIGALAVDASSRTTLSVPCGVPPLRVDGVLYDASTYAAPGTGPEGWGEEQSGTLRRQDDETLQFRADEGTVRLQFVVAHPGRRLPTCER